METLPASSKHVNPTAATDARRETAPTRPKVTNQNRVHCRVCGFTPRGSLYVKSLKEQVLNHIRKKHRDSMLDIVAELDILYGQEKGVDDRCLVHARSAQL
jgi:hypothetical protein